MSLKTVLFCPSARPYCGPIDGNFMIGSDVLLMARVFAEFSCRILFFPHSTVGADYAKTIQEVFENERLEVVGEESLLSALHDCDAILTDVRRIVLAISMVTLKPVVFYSPFHIPVNEKDDVRLATGRVCRNLDEVITALGKIANDSAALREQIRTYRDEDIFSLKFTLP